MKLISFFILFSFFSLYPQHLEQAKIAFEQKEFQYALTRIDRAIQENPNDYKIYNLQAKIYFKQKKIFDALRSLEKSIRLFPKQKQTLQIIIEKYFFLKSIQKSFDYSRMYQKFFPDNPNILYTLVLSASQLRKFKVYNQSIQKLRNLSKEDFFQEIENLNQKNNFLQISKKCKEKQNLFLWSEKFHSYCIFIYNQIKSKDLERAYLNRAIVFYENPLYTFEYAIFLYTQNKRVSAITMFRRSFIYFLKEEKIENVIQSLLPILHYYQELKKISDEIAIRKMIKILSKQEKLQTEKIFSLLKQTSFNWELSYFSLLFFQKKNEKKYYKTILKKIKKKEDSLNNIEFFQGNSPFKKENFLEILKLNKL